jgi:hypothetical protein
MKQLIKPSSLVILLFLLLGLHQEAVAHVSYTNLDSINGSNAGILDTFTDYGWNQGTIQPSATSPLLEQGGARANTDDVNWYRFSLSQAANITISVSNNTAAVQALGNILTSIGVSLYSGLMVDQAFDITSPYSNGVVDPINNPNGYLLNQPIDQRGLVNTLGSFALTTDDNNAASNVRTIYYIESTTDANTGVATLTASLQAGDYTVLVGGNNPWVDVNESRVIYNAQINFSTAPVPVPATAWLMGSVLAGLSITGKRKKAKA